MKLFFCCVALFLATCSVRIKGVPQFRFANIFGDHMVLQQTLKRAMVWGFGEVGQEVVLTFAGDMYRSFVIPGQNGVGVWSALLTPQSAGGPYTITAHSLVNEAAASATLEDVLFGDVWLCSGQSNMEFTVIQSDNGGTAINDSVKYPHIRVFTAAEAESNSTLSELESVELPWSIPSKASIGGPAWTHFSAVCWYYGVELYKKLQYPVGLIATTWGGTPVEAWSSPDALAKCNITAETGKSLFRDGMSTPQGLSVLWNAMIYPFINMTIYGTIWYQGEQNAEVNIHSYNCTFPAMIDDWREKWYESTAHNTDDVFPFGFVQLSAVGDSTTSQTYNFAPLRWNQTAQYGYVPNKRQKRVFMAVAMDLGNPNSPASSIHPTDKTDVGIRLSLAGFSVAYGIDTYYSGPLVSTIAELDSGSLVISYTSVQDTIDVRSPNGFQLLCGTEWVNGQIFDYSSKAVYVRPMTSGCKPQAVRYAWSDYPCIIKKCAIYSGNLPSPPFIKTKPFINSIPAR